MNESIRIIQLEELTMEHLSDKKGKQVTIQHPNGRISALVKEVSSLRKSEGAPGRHQPFSVILKCDLQFEPTQALVRIEHDDFWLQDVMVTPVLKPQDELESPHFYFEAIFT